MRTPAAYPLPIMAGLLLTALGNPCRAGELVNTIAVTTTADALDAFDQRCSLREALHNANTNTRFSPVADECVAGSGSMTDVIALQTGESYMLTLPGDGDDAGDLDIHGNNPDLPPGLDALQIEASGDQFAALIIQQVPGQRVIENHQARTTLKDVWLNSGEAVNGGGIYNAGGVMLLEEVGVEYSAAKVDGGGLYNEGDMTIQGGNWAKNVAGHFGGSIYHANGTMRLIGPWIQSGEAVAGGGIYNVGNLTIESKTRIFNNNVATSHGGGIANAGSGSLVVSDSTIEEGVAFGGGGIINTDSARLVLVDTLVRANEANKGGGIYSESTVPFAILRSRIAENKAEAEGGGLFVGGLGNAAEDSTITRSLFVDNQAGVSGGGLSVTKMSLAIANTTISRNTAAGTSGGNLSVAQDAIVVATNATITATGTGANVVNAGMLSLQNSIISSDSVACITTQPVFSLGNNLASDDSCVGLDGPGDRINTNALLMPLADNGGNTLTHALLAASPAIDAGNTAACESELVDGFDQRGGTRPAGAGCDIGAYEKGASLPIFADGFE